MKDPNKAKGIMYVIMFAGFVPFGIGSAFMEDIPWLAVIFFLLGGALFIASLVYGIKNVRCPHCGQIQNLKLWPITTCPYCKKRVDRLY
ncbi:MAG: hypothetical protein IKR76_01470 [Ruminococcus sp.]|nr:hypothetical protein [Ruminococcus sp.]